MNGYRFFADLPGTASLPALGPKPVSQLKFFGETGQHVNCIALVVNDNGRTTSRAMGATHTEPNSDTAFDRVAAEYIGRCVRIPETIARKLHPKLFERLDALV